MASSMSYGVQPTRIDAYAIIAPTVNLLRFTIFCVICSGRSKLLNVVSFTAVRGLHYYYLP